jgi:hypothetical protein
LTKSQIVGKAIEAQRASHIAELENNNAQLRVELDAAHSKLAEVEGHEWALTSAYEEVKKYFNDSSSSHDARRTQWARLGDGVWSSPLTLLCLIFWDGSGRRLQRCPPPSQSVTRILLVTLS